MEQLIALVALSIMSIGLIAVILGMREFTHLLAESSSPEPPTAKRETKLTGRIESAEEENELSAAV
jgi:hypothetical protein